jgi:ketosteroid isomerase-like protein
MVFNKLRIIEAGPTTNSWEDIINGEWKEGQIIIKPESLASLVALGNERPIHARRSHNGLDMLDDYLGSFSNFVEENGVVYADLTISEAAQEAYPNEIKFIVKLIEKEPEMLGVSVMDLDYKVYNVDENTFEVIEFLELFSCDLVGLPSATSSLFSNNNQNRKSMGFFTSLFSKFAEEKAEKEDETKLADQVVSTVNGEKITIKASGEEAAIGDEVVREDGSPVEDGEVIVDLGEEGKIILVIKDGKIAEFKEYTEEVKTEEEVSKTPDEFSRRLQAVEQSLGEIKTLLSRQTKTPAQQERNDASKSKQSPNDKTQLSKEDRRKAAYEAMQRYCGKK